MIRATPTDTEIRLFRHSLRREWGVAALLWEREGKRGYQFSDGKLRVFKEGYYHLFEPAQPPGDGSATVVRRLARLARADDVTEATRLPTLRDQITLFRRSYPQGFTGAWLKDHRGHRATKRLKRHRDPAIRDAQGLGPHALDLLIEARDWLTVRARVVELASDTDLVPSAQVKRLRALEPSAELAVAIREWLATDLRDDDAERRFNLLVRLLGKAGTWPVVTLLAGLVDPERHICVRSSVFAEQATMLLANFTASRQPSFAVYLEYLNMAKTVFDELEDAGLHPRDLIDIHDFIWVTLRPSTRADLLAQAELPPPPEVAAPPEVAVPPEVAAPPEVAGRDAA